MISIHCHYDAGVCCAADLHVAYNLRLFLFERRISFFTILFRPGLFTFVLCVDSFYFILILGRFRWCGYILFRFSFGLGRFFSSLVLVCNVCALLFSRVKFIVVVVVAGVFFLRFWKFGL